MKNIKTYEGFLDLFKKKFIFDYVDQIDSYLDDLKDISVGFYKYTHRDIPENIIYCFCIRDYKSKKYEVDIFLKEIKSACKSIGFNVYINTEYYSDIKTGGVFDYIVLDFGKKKSGIDFRYTLDTLISQLGIRTLCKYY